MLDDSPVEIEEEEEDEEGVDLDAEWLDDIYDWDDGYRMDNSDSDETRPIPGGGDDDTYKLDDSDSDSDTEANLSVAGGDESPQRQSRKKERGSEFSLTLAC